MDAVSRIFALVMLALFAVGITFLYLRETFVYVFVEEVT